MYHQTHPTSRRGTLRKIEGLEQTISRGWFWKRSFNVERRRKHYLSEGDIERAKLEIRRLKASLGKYYSSSEWAELKRKEAEELKKLQKA